MDSTMHTIDETTVYYYTGPERRQANKPRRRAHDRRYRLRDEALISDFRTPQARRAEDADGFIETGGLIRQSTRSATSSPKARTRK
jgi:hypothetical protein